MSTEAVAGLPPHERAGDGLGLVVRWPRSHVGFGAVRNEHVGWSWSPRAEGLSNNEMKLTQPRPARMERVCAAYLGVLRPERLREGAGL